MTKTAYNDLGRPTFESETLGTGADAKERVTRTTYEVAGCQRSEELTSSEGTPLPRRRRQPHHDLLARPTVVRDGKDPDALLRSRDRPSDEPHRLGGRHVRRDLRRRRADQPEDAPERPRGEDRLRRDRRSYEAHYRKGEDVWLDFEVTESVHGQWRDHKGTLSSQQ